MGRGIVIFFCLFALAFSKTIYVSPAVTSGTGTQANPFPNLLEAVTASTSGDTITLSSGVYSGTNNSGIVIASKTLTFVGVDQNSVNISSTNTFTITNSSIVNFRLLSFFQCDTPIQLLDAASSINFKDVTLMLNQGMYGTVVTYKSAGSVTISNSWIETNIGTVFLLASGSSILIDNCTVLNNFAIADTASVIGVAELAATNITLSNSYFGNNFRVVTAYRGNLVSFNNNYFNNSQTLNNGQTAAILVCYQNTMVATSTNDKVCGYRPSFSCNGLTDQLAYPFDSCGVCGGLNEQQNCLGQCFRGSAPNASCPVPKNWYVSVGGRGDMSGSSLNNSLPTINAALAKVGAGDVILLSPGVYNSTGNSRMMITKDITIKGTCGVARTILGGLYDTDPYLMQISYSTYNLKIQDLTISAYANSGNVIINPLAAVTFQNVIFHQGYSSTQAAAINANGGSALLMNCQFDNNLVGGSGAAIMVTSPQYSTGFIQVDNSRFLANTAALSGGAIYIARGSNAVITNSVFSENVAANGGSAIALETNVRVKISGNSFFNHTSPLLCTSTPFLAMGQNQFCGNVGSNTFSCGNYTAPLTTTFNKCQVCGNVAAIVDCAGDCWGSKITDSAGGCCDSCDKDCAGICFGNATYDKCGICNGKNACISSSQNSGTRSGSGSNVGTSGNFGNSTNGGDQISIQVESEVSNLKWILIGAIVGGVLVIVAVTLVIVLIVKKRRAKDGYF